MQVTKETMTTWIEHVKSVYQKGKSGGMSYKAALKAAAKTWKKKGKASSKKSEPVEQDDAPAAAPKKKRRRRKLAPKVPAKAFKNIDSIAIPKRM